MNAAGVTWSTMESLASTIDRLPAVLMTIAATVALLGAAALPQGPAVPSRAAESEHLRLTGLQRDATALLTRAARPDTPFASRTAALRDAADRLRTLAADPPATAGAAAPPLDGDLRAALRAAADTVAALAAAPDQRGDVAPILALLERARVRLEGEVALGLTFQGGFSQSKVKDPVYGGHATAMGPAPVRVRRRAPRQRRRSRRRSRSKKLHRCR